MEWYVWVIITLAMLAIIVVILCVRRAIKVAEEATVEFIVKPWLKGNFGKRGK